MKYQLITITIITLLTQNAAHAVSTSILQPVSVTSGAGHNHDNAPENLIGQEGLISKYESAITSWDTIDDFRHLDEDYWQADVPRDPNRGESFPYPLTFDLGSEYIIHGIALWNGVRSRGVVDFEVYADDNNNLNDEKEESQFSLFQETETMTTPPMTTFTTAPLNTVSVPVQTFSFDSPMRTQFIHMNLLSNQNVQGNFDITEIYEIAFESSPVPIEFGPIPEVIGFPVPFEFGPIPGIIGFIAAMGINYFRFFLRDRKDSDD